MDCVAAAVDAQAYTRPMYMITQHRYWQRHRSKNWFASDMMSSTKDGIYRQKEGRSYGSSNFRAQGVLQQFLSYHMITYLF